MKICSKEMAAIIFGAGGPSFGSGGPNFGPNPVWSSTVSSAPSFSSNSSGSSSAASNSGGFMSLLGNITGTDSGVTNGVRDDGMPLGFGCGDAKTDHLVPDRVLGNDLTGACYNHDIAYSTLGVSKEAADAKLGKDVSNAMGGGILGALVGGAYQLGLSLFGQAAYNSAQAQASENAYGTTGWGSRDAGGDHSPSPSNGGENGGWGSRDAGGDRSGESSGGDGGGDGGGGGGW